MQLATLLAHVDVDRETTQLVTRAFDEACGVLQPPDETIASGQYASFTRIILANRVVELALQRERDVDHLIDGALDYLDRQITSQWARPPLGQG